LIPLLDPFNFISFPAEPPICERNGLTMRVLLIITSLWFGIEAKLKSNELPSSPSQFPGQSPIDNQLRRNDFITGENSKMVGNYVRKKTTRPLEAEDDRDRFYKRQRGQVDPIEIEEPSLDKIAQEQPMLVDQCPVWCYENRVEFFYVSELFFITFDFAFKRDHSKGC
ncbi:6100_t:CDS:2, partial [Ambispora leptoticha]